MKKFMVNAFLMALVCSTLIYGDLAKANTEKNDDVSMDRPAVFSFEILGRGGYYSLDFDYSVNDEISLGAGLAAYSLSSNSSSASIVILPLYGNFYFQPGPHRGFLSAGLDIVSISANLSGTSFGASGVAPVLGGGYEYRGENGFVFRGAPYLVIGNSQIGFTIGLSFGYAF
jgi:hypothetical protein